MVKLFSLKDIVLTLLSLSAAVMLGAYLYQANSSESPSAELCQFTLLASDSSGSRDVIEVSVWADAYAQFCWRAYGPVKAARQVKDYTIQVQAKSLHMSNNEEYRQELWQAAEAGVAPDLLFARAQLWSEWKKWIEAGYLVPLDQCRKRYREFNNVADQVWSDVTWQGEIWGVPAEVGMGLFYFNKVKLKALGWPDQQIEQLPQKIQRGTFTLEDMLFTIQQAIETGVIAPGFGYWSTHSKRLNFLLTYGAYGGRLYTIEQDKLMINRQALYDAYAFRRRLITEQATLEAFTEEAPISWADTLLRHDTVANGRVLFFTADDADWLALTMDYMTDRAGQAQFSDVIGYALYPSGISGHGGKVLWHHTGFYGITSERASGRKHQEAACALLAQIATPEIEALYVQTSGYHGALPAHKLRPVLISGSFSAETLYMQD